MSAFILKLIALVVMGMDHVGKVFLEWNILEYTTCNIFSSLGRIAFPIFSFLIVTGFCKTKDLDKYTSRLVLFASISQIPFTLALYMVNLMSLESGKTEFLFRNNIFIVISIILVLAYWHLQNKKSYGAAAVACLALVIAGISVRMNGTWIIYSGSLNVFYTLAMGLITISSLNKLFLIEKQKWYKWLFILLTNLLGIVYIGTRSDYGIAGIILICGIFLFKEKKGLQVTVICLWCIIFYGILIGNITNAIWACLSSIAIILYNGKKGISLKYFFYLFYPIHLLILGLINIFYRYDFIN